MKHKSGYDILKEKYLRLQEDYANTREIIDGWNKSFDNQEKMFDKELKELQDVVEKQKSRISELEADSKAGWDTSERYYKVLSEKHTNLIDALDCKRMLQERCDKLWQHMGAFRRWTWKLKHKSDA